MNQYVKKDSETDFEYGLRLIEIKVEQKPEDLEWGDIVNLLGLDIHKDSLRKAASTTPYSGYAVMKYFQEKLQRDGCDCGENKISQKLEEIYKATINMRDERNELNRMKRNGVRNDRLIDIFRQIITEEVKPREAPTIMPVVVGDMDMVVVLSDIHYGLVANNVHNHYSPAIAQDRMSQYLNEIYDNAERYGCQNCYLFLGGDLINGAIRSTTRISNSENVIGQVKGVSELISDFTFMLSRKFNHVHVYSVPGNHSRIFQNKEENQLNEYLDNLVPFYLKASLQSVNNVSIHEDQYDGELCKFTVRGHTFVGVHGHHDTVQNVVTNMQKMIHERPDVILMGHRHQNALHTIDRVKVIESGSLSSTDDYCMEKRYVGYPEQALIIVSERRCVESFQDVQLE